MLGNFFTPNQFVIASQNMANSARRVIKLHLAYSEAVNTQQKNSLAYLYKKEAFILLARCLKLLILLFIRGDRYAKA